MVKLAALEMVRCYDTCLSTVPLHEARGVRASGVLAPSSHFDRIDHEPVLGERLEASHPRPSVAALVGSTPGVKGASTQGDSNDALACTLPIQQHCNVRTTAMAEFAILICSMHSCPLKDILACRPGFGESETPCYS